MAQPRSIDCALCHGPYPDDLVRRIKSAKTSAPMTLDEFRDWLSKID